MSGLIRETNGFHESIRRIDTSDPVDASIVNIQPQQLLDNDHYLRDMIEAGAGLESHIEDKDNPHDVTHDQTNPAGAAPSTSTAKDKHISNADYKSFTEHVASKGNPHEITHGQTNPAGAASSTNATKDKHISNADYKSFTEHVASKNNPHEVTRSQIGAAAASHGNEAHSTNFMPQSGGTFSGSVTLGSSALLRKTSGGSTTTIIDNDGRLHQAVYNDMAEFLPVSEKVNPGDVVIWTEDGIKACETAGHKGVIGVVSDTFGPALGGDPGKSIEETLKGGKFAPVALVGRVWVKAVGPIKMFDLLEGSNVKGFAQSAASYTQQQEGGTIVGKALEALAAGERRRICMLVMNR